MMESRKIVFKETAVIAVGVAVCCGLMVGVFALVGSFDLTVLWGALVGYVLTVANFLFMAIGTSLAADKAQNQNTAGGKTLISLSAVVRLVVLALLLFAFAKSGICHILALVLPLVFVRPVMFAAEFFRKKG